MADPYKQGRKAYHEGLEEEDNPYDADTATESHERWLDGWTDAFDENEDPDEGDDVEEEDEDEDDDDVDEDDDDQDDDDDVEPIDWDAEDMPNPSESE